MKNPYNLIYNEYRNKCEEAKTLSDRELLEALYKEVLELRAMVRYYELEGHYITKK